MGESQLICSDLHTTDRLLSSGRNNPRKAGQRTLASNLFIIQLISNRVRRGGRVPPFWANEIIPGKWVYKDKQ